MPFQDGSEKWEEIKLAQRVPTGNEAMDVLLGGGLLPELVHLFYGDRGILTRQALRTCVNFFIVQGTFNRKVAFIDVNNRFNPYEISKLGASKRLSPKTVLESILISRAFTWEQLVELLEHTLGNVESKIGMVIVSGITTLFPAHDLDSFEALQKAISGIKKLMVNKGLYLLLIAPKHEHSKYKPKGGKVLTHFGHVLVNVEDGDRLTKYQLIQHPFMAEDEVKKFKARVPKRAFKHITRNQSIDKWL